MFQLYGKYHDMAIAVKHPCHLNLAACLLKIHKFDEAIGQCAVVGLLTSAFHMLIVIETPPANPQTRLSPKVEKSSNWVVLRCFRTCSCYENLEHL